MVMVKFSGDGGGITDDGSDDNDDDNDIVMMKINLESGKFREDAVIIFRPDISRIID
jgi:hypothetical protein